MKNQEEAKTIARRQATPSEKEIFCGAVFAFYAHSRCQLLARQLSKLSAFICDTYKPKFRDWVERQEKSLRSIIDQFSTDLQSLLKNSSCTPLQFCELVKLPDDFFTIFLRQNPELATFLEHNLGFLEDMMQLWYDIPNSDQGNIDIFETNRSTGYRVGI